MFPTLGTPFSTRHHGRWDAGQLGATSGGQPTLLAAVPLVTSHSSSLHRSSLQSCCGMERLMNKSIPLGAEAAKLGCKRRSSAGAGGLTAGVAPLVNSPHAAAADRAACSQVGSSDCLLAMFYLSKRSICRLAPAVPHFSWILLPGNGSSSLKRGRGVLPAPPGPGGHRPLRLPMVGSHERLASPCRAAVTRALCRGDEVPRCEQDGAVRLTFPELGKHF